MKTTWLLNHWEVMSAYLGADFCGKGISNVHDIYEIHIDLEIVTVRAVYFTAVCILNIIKGWFFFLKLSAENNIQILGRQVCSRHQKYFLNSKFRVTCLYLIYRRGFS